MSQNGLVSNSFSNMGSKSLSESNLRKNPRTSMSQIRLSELGKGYDDGLDTFGLDELRDGFFDPIYNKPVNVPKAHKKLEKSTTWFNGIYWGGNTAEWLHYLTTIRKNYFKHWIIISKFTFAYIISIILCLTDNPGNWFGRYRTFLPISTLINHPVHSVGTQIEMTIQSIVGMAIGLGWSSLSLYISTATQPTRNHQGGILFGSLFLGLMVMGWIRTYFIRFYYVLLTACFVLIFMSTSLDLEDNPVNWKNTWNIAIPYMFGLLVSLFVSIVYFPYSGTTKVSSMLLDLTGSIKGLLIRLSTQESTEHFKEIVILQKSMIHSSLMLSDAFREFLSGVRLSNCDDDDLKSVRNHLNFIVSALRVIPADAKIYMKKENISKSTSTPATRTESSMNLSALRPGTQTPLPMLTSNHLLGIRQQFQESFYISVTDDAFNIPLFKLLTQMIDNLEATESVMKYIFRINKVGNEKEKRIEELEHSKLLLKKRIHQIDYAYRKFSKTEYFCRDLLNEESVTKIFLFLRYSRQAAVMLLDLSDIIVLVAKKTGKFSKIHLPNYPLKRALRRLPQQCLRDQGADFVFYYFETKLEVDDVFQRIYNLNTSRQRDRGIEADDEKSKPIRAIDHNDFTFHSTSSKFRLKAWMASKMLTGNESKYAFKVSTVITFLALPAWLRGSWGWYYRYDCFWCPLLVFYFLSPRNSGTWSNWFTRTICWFIGSFWGWAAIQSRHFHNPFVIAVFAGLICLVFSYGFLVATHPRSSIVTLLSFTIVAVSLYTKHDNSTSEIIKNTWIISVAIYISIMTSILTNWLIWPFVARRELYKSCALILSHISQSYQSVSERYLYRDLNDDPTDLTLELASIREVRMSQSLLSLKELLKKARNEHDFLRRFKPDLFEQFLDSCEILLEKIIEARMSGVYFRVWEQDKDEKITESLFSVRRDSVTTVIYILFMLSTSIRSKTSLPKYLPSAISVRKRLYDIISKLEVQRETRREWLADQSSSKPTEVSNNEKTTRDNKSYLKTHWTEVHGMAFASAYTSITEELENLKVIAKEILGEESLIE